MEENELTSEEIKLLQLLKNSTKPPLAMENNLVEKLKNEGLIKEQSKAVVWMYRVAAAVALFVIGYLAGQQIQAVPATDYNYMLVLYEDDNFKPEHPESLFEEYSQWMQGIYEKGISIDGQEMKEASAIINNQGMQALDRTVGGYFVINASNKDQAMAIAKECPHYKHGGTIEVKEFMIRN